MSSYKQILYIVFRTKNSKKTLSLEASEDLYRYIWGIIKAKKCFLYRINGMENHIHFLSDLNPSIALADFMRDIKTASSIWLKNHKDFSFDGWSDGYAAFTYAYQDKNTIINYIKNQREHHKMVTFENELEQLLTEHGVSFDRNFFP